MTSSGSAITYNNISSPLHDTHRYYAYGMSTLLYLQLLSCSLLPVPVTSIQYPLITSSHFYYYFLLNVSFINLDCVRQAVGLSGMGQIRLRFCNDALVL